MTRYALLIVAALAGLAGCGKNPVDPGPSLSVEALDVRVGTGVTATLGRVVLVDYTGWLHDAALPDGKGTQFDTSIGAAAFPFLLGYGQVISGWDVGVPGMRVGGMRRLKIPPELAYGAEGRGSIPPNATLIFDIELLAVQ